MGHLLLAAVLVAFMAPAMAETDSALFARTLPEGTAVGRASDARGAATQAATLATVGARPRRLMFAGAVVAPAGGAHPARPVIRMLEAVQTISKSEFRVLEVVYR